MRITIEYDVTEPALVIDVLQSLCDLSKHKLKDAMQCGSVWLSRSGQPMQGIRKASSRGAVGDHLALYYDEPILAYAPPDVNGLWSWDDDSDWYPVAVLGPASPHGDHAGL